MKTTAYRLALLQMRMSPRRGENIAKAEAMLREAAAAGAQVALLPELFQTPYFCQKEEHAFFDLAEEIPGPSTVRFSALAAELGIVIIASLFEKRATGLYHNTCLTFDRDGALCGKYRKMHIPDDPGFYEKFYFTPGDLGYSAVSTDAGKIGVLVCWDQWYPEAARLTAMQGAGLLVYPTAIGWLPEDPQGVKDQQHEAWRTVQRGHAVANGVYVAACNRTGFEPAGEDAQTGLQFWGRSFICDPFGQVIAEAATDAEEIIYATIDPARQEEIRRTWPFFRDRRVDSYGTIGRIFADC